MANELNTKDIIVGYENEVAQVEQLRDLLLNQEKYNTKGIHTPNGVMFYGCPGVGKTKLAKSIATEGITLFELNSNEKIEKSLHELFKKARENTPCVILLDDIDKILEEEGVSFMKGQSKYNKMLLTELDGVKDNNGILVVATCNKVSNLNPAILRAGRFDRIIEVELPSCEDREKIFSYYYNKINSKIDIDLQAVAKETYGFSGAEIECLVNETSIIAIENKKECIDYECFQIAKNRIIYKGFGKKINDNVKHMVAVHEAGHAILALYLKPNSVSNVSIIEQKGAKGQTQLLMNEETINCNRFDFDDITIALGGKVAEIIEFGNASSGCLNDMKIAVMDLDIMITEVGTCGYEYLINYSRHGVIPDSQKEKVISMRNKILNELHKKAEGIILEHKDVFKKIVAALEEKQSLNRNELLEFVA